MFALSAFLLASICSRQVPCQWCRTRRNNQVTAKSRQRSATVIWAGGSS
jgi:hypothetical protein